MTGTAVLLVWTGSLIIAFVSETLKATEWCVLTHGRNIFERDPCLEIAPANPFQLSPVPRAPVKPCRRITDTGSEQFWVAQSTAKALRELSTSPAPEGAFVQGPGKLLALALPRECGTSCPCFVCICSFFFAF